MVVVVDFVGVVVMVVVVVEERERSLKVRMFHAACARGRTGMS